VTAVAGETETQDIAGETETQDVAPEDSESFFDGLISALGDWLDFSTSDEPAAAAQSPGAEDDGGLLSMVPFAGQTGTNVLFLALVALLLLGLGFGLRRIQRRKRA